MEKTGVIEAKARTGKSIKVDGEWYSAFSASQLSEVDRGDEIKFTYTSTKKDDKTFLNVKGNAVKIAAGRAPVAGGSTSTSRKGWVEKEFPVPPLHPDRAIVRQNSLTHATNVVIYTLDACEGTEAFVEAVIAAARKFEAYSTGDLDKEIAEREMADMKGAVVDKA